MFKQPYRTAAAIIVLSAGSVLAADHGGPSPCASSATIWRGDTISSIADRCGVSQAALLNANPSVESSADLQVGGTLHVGTGESTQQKVGSVLGTLSRKTTNAVGALAGNVGASGHLLDKSPDLKNRLDALGRKVGPGHDETAATLSVSPLSGAPGSSVLLAAPGLPKSTPVAIGAGPPGSAYSSVGNAQTNGTVWVLDFLFACLIGIAFQYFAIVPMRNHSSGQSIVAALKADTLSLVSTRDVKP